MPTKDAVILAKSSYDALERWWRGLSVGAQIEHRNLSDEQRRQVESSVAAAAIDRHMVQIGWNGLSDAVYPMNTKGVQENYYDPVYRITQEPKEREDGALE